LHDAALKFEQAQSRHFNAKKRVSEAEKKSTTVDGKLDPALQEMMNQATIEVCCWCLVRKGCVHLDV